MLILGIGIGIIGTIALFEIITLIPGKADRNFERQAKQTDKLLEYWDQSTAQKEAELNFLERITNAIETIAIRK